MDTTMKLYDIVYIDPPWQFNKRSNTNTSFGGGAMAHYPTMPMKDIAALDFTIFMKENALMYCWVTLAKLPECIEAIQKPNLQFVTTGFVWIKTNPVGHSEPQDGINIFDPSDNTYRKPFYGVGNYTASNAEICLIFRKGKMVKHKEKVSQVLLTPREKHSKKPKEAYNRLETMYPSSDFNKIEIFARNSSTGFDVVGNQHNNIQIEDFIQQYKDYYHDVET